MALEYKSQIGLDAIMPVLDEHVVWYGRLVKAYFEGKPYAEAAPLVFSEWLVKAKNEKSIADTTADRVRRIHEGMIHAAHNFSSKFESRDNPPLDEFNELTKYYEEFIQSMRQIELDQAVENSGYDDKTGLRSAKVLQADYDREMERRSRRGNPFSLVLLKLNNYDEAWQAEEKMTAAIIRKLSGQIKESLRSFDDAYYLGGEYFLLALKHADLHGSQSAMVRLNQSVSAAHVQAPVEPYGEVTISSVVSEPTQGDKLDGLLANMKKDLVGVDAKGAVLQYNDLSPLQRYIHSMNQQK